MKNVYFVPDNARIIRPADLAALLNEHGSYREVAKELGVGIGTLSTWVQIANLKITKTTTVTIAAAREDAER